MEPALTRAVDPWRMAESNRNQWPDPSAMRSGIPDGAFAREAAKSPLPPIWAKLAIDDIFRNVADH
jgi:hypothetical protein